MPHRRRFFAYALMGIGAVLVYVPAAFVQAAPATMYLSPSAGSFFVGSTFDVSILLNTGGSSVNTVEVALDFPENVIQIANPSIGKSIIQVWATNPTFSNRTGQIYFVGGIPSPGIQTSNGVVLTMTFRVIAPSSGTINFGERTRVLANDGSGTDILTQATHGSYTFLPVPPQGPAISSPTHPDQTKYYKNSSPTFDWTKDPGTEAFSYTIDEDPNGLPDTVSEGTDSSTSFDSLADGIWYFHVRAKKSGVWGGTSSFMAHVDTRPPAEFKTSISPGNRTSEQRPVTRFFTTDSLSGLDHYELKLVPLALQSDAESAFFFGVNSPYQFSPLEAGRYTLIVRAYDKAGNWRDSEENLTITTSFFRLISNEGVDLVFLFLSWEKILSILAGLILALVLLLTIFWYRHKDHLRKHFKKI